MEHRDPDIKDPAMNSAGDMEPFLHSDLLHKIALFLPPTLNICLASKAFKAGRTPHIVLSEFTGDWNWLWEEVMRESSDYMRKSLQHRVLWGAASQRGAWMGG